MENEYVFKTLSPQERPQMSQNSDPVPLIPHFNGLNTPSHRVTLPEKVLTSTMGDPIEDLPSVFHTTHFTGA